MTKKRYVILILLAIVGIALSTLSLYHFVTLHLGAEHAASSCAISEHIDCTKVHLSAWSKFFNIPLASYGLGFYLLLIVVAFLGIVGRIFKQDESRDFILLSSLVASLSSCALFYISEFIVGFLCIVCIGMYFVNFSLLGASFFPRPKYSFVQQLKNAFRAGFRLLGIWIPNRVPGEFIVRFATVISLCLTLGLVLTSEALMTKMYLSSNAEAGNLDDQKKARIIAPYIDEWEKEPVVQLAVSRGPALSGDHTKGKENAAIQIVEFSDFGCPHCQQLGAALTEMSKQYPGAFEVYHKDFPLDSTCNQFSPPVHLGSCKAAEFARCAGEQGEFWSVAEYFYASGTPEVTTEAAVQDKLLAEAESLGLDRDAMQECLSSRRQLEKIKKDAAQGDSLKLQATPSVWINGKFLRTPHPDIVRAIIEKLMRQSQ